MREVRLRLIARTIALTVWPFVAISGAQEASAANYQLAGSVPGGGGGGSGFGTLTFTSDYRFTWTGSVRDVCPADARGVELQFVVRHFDGTQSVKEDVVHDEDGCGTSAVSGSGSFTFTKKVKNVMVVLYSTKDEDPWVTLDLSPDKDNPYN